ncbi:MAG: (d)CMP kinase [Actinomycetota bacterium]|nr:(d)CMP kinase [Actinomycetota bacterium]
MSAPVRRVVAIDGPSGSGKSTVARGVAKALTWRYVDTGATYRAATLAALRGGLDPRCASGEALGALVGALTARAAIELSTDPDDTRVRLDGTDVTTEIRGPEVTAAVSALSALPEVRLMVVDLQRALIGAGGCVVEGRDIGTVVLPEAALKVYLDAAPTVRARRRAKEPEAGVGRTGGGAVQVDDVLADLARRDGLDSTRPTSPLQAAPDAVHLDSSALSAVQVIEAVLRLAARVGLVGDAG